MGQTRKKNWRKRGMVLDIDMAALRAANQAADEEGEEEDDNEPEDENRSPSPEAPVAPQRTSVETKNLPISVPVGVAATPQAKLDVSMWKKVEDASGKPYYWNQENNSTSWEPPVGWEPSKTDDNDNDDNSSSDKNGSSHNHIDDLAEEDKTADDGDVSADEWAATVDPNTGKEYYWNKITGETSWELPVKPPTSSSTITPSTVISTVPVPPAVAETAKENKEPPSPKKERKKHKKRSRSRSRSVSIDKEKSRSRSRSSTRDKDSKKSKKKKHSHNQKKKDKEKDRSKKKDKSDSEDEKQKDYDKERQRDKEKRDDKERKEQERKKEAQREQAKEQLKIARETKRRLEKLEQQREKEREEGQKEAEERAAETRTKTIVNALSAGIQARVSSLSKIVGLPDRKIAPLDKFKVELEIRIADWKEGATTSAWALGKLQVLAGQLDGIIAEEKEALRESERLKQEEAQRAQETSRQDREVDRRRRRPQEEQTREPASSRINGEGPDESVYAPFGSSKIVAKPDVAVAPPVHPSRLALIAKSEPPRRPALASSPRKVPLPAAASPPRRGPPPSSSPQEPSSEEEESSEENIDGVPVTVHQRPPRKHEAAASGDFEASSKKEKKKRSTKQVFGKQMGALVNKWTKVQKAVDKEARRMDEETSVTGRRVWRAEMDSSGQAAGSANFVELGKRASLVKRRRDDDE